MVRIIAWRPPQVMKRSNYKYSVICNLINYLRIYCTAGIYCEEKYFVINTILFSEEVFMILEYIHSKRYRKHLWIQ